MAGNVVFTKRPAFRRLPLLALNGWHSLRHNPIILKELRQRMRSWHGLVDLAVCTAMLSIFGLINYNWLITNQYRTLTFSSTFGTGSYVARSQELGTNYFITVVIAQLFLACILTPSFSATTIAGEKERQTYDVLLVTLLRPRDIIAGKLFSALAYLLLVTVAGLPVASIAFLMGGVGLDELAAALLVMLLTGVLLGSIGIFWSSATRSSHEASRNTFLNIIALLFVLPLGILFLINLIVQPLFLSSLPYYGETLGRDALSWVLSVNPMYAIMGTNDILKTRPGSNILFFTNTPGDFSLTPFFRFSSIGLILSVLYIWLAARRIRPLQPEVERHSQTSGKRK